MEKLELVRNALRELGNVSSQELSAFIEKMHAFKIESKFIPIFRASIKDMQRSEAARQVARGGSGAVVAV